MAQVKMQCLPLGEDRVLTQMSRIRTYIWGEPTTANLFVKVCLLLDSLLLGNTV